MALSANRDMSSGYPSNGAADLEIIITNASVIYDGAMCCVNASGTIVRADSAVASLRWAGVAFRGGTGNAGGTVKAAIGRKAPFIAKKTAAAATDLFKTAYVKDDEYVQTTPPSTTGGNDYIAGEIVKIIDSTHVIVDPVIRAAGLLGIVKSVYLPFGALTQNLNTSHTIIMPSVGGTIQNVKFVGATNVAANDTNYWTFGLLNKTGTTTVVDATAAANSTKVTGGSALTQYTARALTLTNANVAFNGNDVMEVSIVGTASATNITEGSLKIEFIPAA